MQLRPDLPNVAAISLAHSYGFSNLVLPLLLHGIPLVIAASPLPDSLRSALQVVAHGHAGGTRAALPGVPALWRAWHAAGVVDPARLAIALSAGAPLPLELERHIHADTGVKVHNFLGSSECGGHRLRPLPRPARPRHTRRHGTRRCRFRSTPPDGSSCAAQPSVSATGRRNRRHATFPTARRTERGIFRTGDLAETRGDAWHLLGRAADTINLAGRKLHPMPNSNRSSAPTRR
jgi:long-chain acyl-CoA synthetase